VLKSPKFIAKDLIEISFDLALTDIGNGQAIWNYLGEENHIDIRISTDCGQTFETVHSITNDTPIRRTGQKERFRIEGYGEQEVILGIFIEEEMPLAEDTGLVLSFDNIQIKEVAARDIGIEAAEGFIAGNYAPDMTIPDDWWVCGDFNYPIQIKLVNHGTMLQNNFEVVGIISEGWNDEFSVLIGEPLYPKEERIITLGTTNTYNAGQYDLEAYIKLPNDDDHSNDTLNAFLLALPPQPSARFFYENEGEGIIQFAKATFPGNPQYEWDFGDGKGSSTFRNPSYVYEENGVYEVTLTVTDDCGSSSHTEMVVVDTVVGIEDIDLEQILTITPNPFNGSFAVKIEGKVIPTAHIQVFTANGQLVFQKKYANFQETMISLNKYSSGIYFLQFATPSGIISLSFFHQ
ncbi:MAG: PKD domain-containing protein, partial [Chitinophagales bacterium]